MKPNWKNALRKICFTVECLFKLFWTNPLIDGSSNVMEIIFFQLVKGVKTFSKMFHNHTLCAKAYPGSCESSETRPPFLDAKACEGAKGSPLCNFQHLK